MAGTGSETHRDEGGDPRTRRRIIWTAVVLAALAIGFYAAFILVTATGR
jgi:hypothetical protein